MLRQVVGERAQDRVGLAVAVRDGGAMFVQRVMASRTAWTRFSALVSLRMACFCWKTASFSLLKHSAKRAVSNFDASSFNPGIQITLRFAAG